MILNLKTASHDHYQQDRKQSKPNRVPGRTPSGVATGHGDGSLEEKLAWMRRRQAVKKLGGRGLRVGTP